MNLPFEWTIGWRYTRAGRAGRRNGFISFISGVSMLGIALGVAALIIVLSVMNGFQQEVRDRMLSVIAHIEVFDASGGALPDWPATAAAARRNRHVVGAAPFVAALLFAAASARDLGVLLIVTVGVPLVAGAASSPAVAGGAPAAGAPSSELTKTTWFATSAGFCRRPISANSMR